MMIFNFGLICKRRKGEEKKWWKISTFKLFNLTKIGKKQEKHATTSKCFIPSFNLLWVAYPCGASSRSLDLASVPCTLHADMGHVNMDVSMNEILQTNSMHGFFLKMKSLNLIEPFSLWRSHWRSLPCSSCRRVRIKVFATKGFGRIRGTAYTTASAILYNLNFLTTQFETAVNYRRARQVKDDALKSYPQKREFTIRFISHDFITVNFNFMFSAVILASLIFFTDFFRHMPVKSIERKVALSSAACSREPATLEF